MKALKVVAGFVGACILIPVVLAFAWVIGKVDGPRG